MKRLTTTGIIAVMIANAAITGTIAANGVKAKTNMDRYYSTLFKVTYQITDSRGWHYIHFADCNGNDWTWTDYDQSWMDVENGEYYTAVMDSMNTERIYDDEIMSLRCERPDLLERQ